MRDTLSQRHDRRALLKNGLVLAGALAVPSAVSAAEQATRTSRAASPPAVPSAPPMAPVPAAPAAPRVVNPALLRRAVAALNAHSDVINHRDKIMIADFSAPSSQARFHFVDLASGKTVSELVAHGSGSDPAHTGWLQRFSNVPSSNASSEGAFLAADYYVGKHGRSQRLIGLDPTNNNALDRAIVVHAAWYANADMLATHGQLGRSQGCFAVGESRLADVFDRLGQGRMIYAAKV